MEFSCFDTHFLFFNMNLSFFDIFLLTFKMKYDKLTLLKNNGYPKFNNL